MAVLVPTTWSPLDKDSTVELSNGDKTAVAYGNGVRSVFGATHGKYYFELAISTGGSGSGQMVGIATPAAALTGYPGADAYGWAYEKSTGAIYNDGAAIQTVSANGTSIGILLDADLKKLRFRRNGVLVGTEITLTGTKWHAIFGYGSTCVANFGASAFAYSLPTGYTSGFGPLKSTISGTVSDAAGAPCARTVRAYDRVSGVLAGSAVSNATTGAYSIDTLFEGDHVVVALDDDAGTSYNVVALDRIVGL